MSIAKNIIIRTNFVVFLSAFFFSTSICSANESICSVNENCDPEKEKEAQQEEKKEEKKEDKKEDKKEEEPPKIGNFALPTSQQPGPLVSFGQNIIDQNQTVFVLYADDFIGSKKRTADVLPGVLYGVRDDLSVFFNVPFAANYKDGRTHSSGLEDIFVQLEYAFYSTKTSTHTNQATVVGYATAPSGSTKKQPATGLGSSSFFLGATFNRMYTDWLFFTSHGVLLTTSFDRTKFGNEFLYQAGIGRNILTIDSEWIFAWLIEADGQYTEKSKIKGRTDPDSGGNVVYMIPSLFVSSKKFLIQVGIGLPVAQHLFGSQKKNNYVLALDFRWTF